MNPFQANVVPPFHLRVVIELGDETPLAVDPAAPLDDEYDDSAPAGPNAVPQFAAGV